MRKRRKKSHLLEFIPQYQTESNAAINDVNHHTQPTTFPNKPQTLKKIQKEIKLKQKIVSQKEEMGNEPWKWMRKVGRWIVARMCNGLISVMKMGLLSWMVIGIVANGVAGAVANGSRWLGLGLGSDHREWCCQGRREWFTTIGFEFGFGPSRMVLPDRREWFCRTVVTGYRWRFRSYRRRWGLTAIGFGSEAWRRLGLGFRGSIGFWF